MDRVKDSIELNVPVEKLFAYYHDPRNVARMTPPELHLRLIRAEKPLREGSRVLFGLRPTMLPFELHWLLTITDYDPPHGFSEELSKGPFTYWIHEHRFEALDNNRSRVTDTIRFGRLTGLTGRLIRPSFVRHSLEKTFHHRREVVKRDLEVGAPR